jgi:hypothetical protein
MPALAQAARATCRLGKGAAIRRWCFLTNFFKGGPFCYFIGAGGLICQKFRRVEMYEFLEQSTAHESSLTCGWRVDWEVGTDNSWTLGWRHGVYSGDGEQLQALAWCYLGMARPRGGIQGWILQFQASFLLLDADAVRCRKREQHASERMEMRPSEASIRGDSGLNRSCGGGVRQRPALLEERRRFWEGWSGTEPNFDA